MDQEAVGPDRSGRAGGQAGLARTAVRNRLGVAARHHIARKIRDEDHGPVVAPKAFDVGQVVPAVPRQRAQRGHSLGLPFRSSHGEAGWREHPPESFLDATVASPPTRVGRGDDGRDRIPIHGEPQAHRPVGHGHCDQGTRAGDLRLGLLHPRRQPLLVEGFVELPPLVPRDDPRSGDLAAGVRHDRRLPSCFPYLVQNSLDHK